MLNISREVVLGENPIYMNNLLVHLAHDFSKLTIVSQNDSIKLFMSRVIDEFGSQGYDFDENGKFIEAEKNDQLFVVYGFHDDPDMDEFAKEYIQSKNMVPIHFLEKEKIEQISQII